MAGLRKPVGAKTWAASYATVGDLPLGGPATGDATVVVIRDTDTMYEWDAGTASWVVISGGGGGVPDNRYYLRYVTNLGVPAGGLQYLSLGDAIACSSCGEVFTAATTLRGLTIVVGLLDAARTYDAEFISNPTGVPSILASLSLPLSTRIARRRDLAVNIPAGTEVGARIFRTSGASKSTFNNVTVLIEVSIP